ncbi:hypothetical protein [Streptomyces acidiscabies]|uniref:Uncharacterized protein n=1 Tax=Streptomyces acidiscabies TaxID=42234 RepID=A0A0L0KKZ0_9ACTN|nr:hypothetical protein [Streptomyces acidiscabies]KND38498.1 hypothetical protein IQ63_07655 [Streptomyces acidiscabies]
MARQPFPIPFGLTTPAFRLDHYRRWIAAGWALDLNDAVRVNALLLRNFRVAEVGQAPSSWAARTAVKQRRRWNHHRRIVLSKAKSCVLCARPPVEITYSKSLSEGGTERLRNKIPVCTVCFDRWPDLRRDLPRQVREKLADQLVFLWGR